ncbi:MAG TPA: alpha/beta hydrolase [Chloroflexota bacterium]|nr:alpha/beta hydrolase [Chloroflexota bacterium]
MPTLHVDGCHLYYEKYGAGPALVFAHGAGGNHLSWWQQIPFFRDRYTCVTFAHRGFGPSRDRPGGPGPDAFVDDLAALIDHLGFDEVRLVAQSMGGWTCLGYALREPTRVRALVMAATIGSLAHPETERLAAENRAANPRQALFAQGVHPACGERMTREQPALHFLYTQVSALTALPAGFDLTAKLHAMRTTPPEMLATLTPPVLCITGEEDVVQPAAGVEVLASLIPRARLVRVPNAGHSVYWERAETFNRLVDEFLASGDS